MPIPAMVSAFNPSLSREEAAAFAAAFFAPESSHDLEPVIQDILAMDGNARAGLAASIKPGGYQDEVEIVASLDRPLMVIHGEHEQIANVEYIAGLDMPTL